MMKKFCFGLGLLSLIFAVGCAKGGNGQGSGVSVSVSGPSVVPVTLNATYTAAVTGSTNTAVTWSISGTACTGTPNPCGSFSSTTATTAVYQAPATAPNPVVVTITATAQADSTAAGAENVNVEPVSVVVTPTTVSVGENLEQQFTAVAIPDSVPQTFSWTCTPTAACANFTPAPNNLGLAVLTAPSAAQTGVQVSATWSSATPENPPGVGTSKISVVSSRLAAGNYAFHFKGYDSGAPVGVTGGVTVGSGGAITGYEEVQSGGTSPTLYGIVSGAFTQAPSGVFSNNEGTLTLNVSNNTSNVYTSVINSSGNIQMIESDATGITGSGVMQKSSAAFNSSAQTFAFGFTGVDSSGKRVGYVGVIPMTPNVNGTGGTIAGGVIDTNDGGVASNLCGPSPCMVTGTYTQLNALIWQMTLNAGSTAFDFDFVVASGVAQTKTAPNALTLYAISTDPILTNPQVSGSMVYQVPMTYNNAAFAGSSVSALTGITANASNVALVNGTTDGKSSGSAGTGGFSGVFDQNDNGMILSASTFPPSTSAPPNPYTYVASSSSNGRYVFQLPVNPSASASAAPAPFVLYASGANRGFMLDQSSSTVFTGAMYPQSTISMFSYALSELPGAYAASTIPNSSPGIMPFVQNLLLEFPGDSMNVVGGTENSGSGALLLVGTSGTGAYSMMSNGTGTITFTPAPPGPAVGTNVICAVDITTVPNPLATGLQNYVVTDFFEMGTTSGTASGIMFAQQ
jgi:hypothetical protein